MLNADLNAAAGVADETSGLVASMPSAERSAPTGKLPKNKPCLNAAWNQLNLVLSFFSRIDTKLSVVLGFDLAMLAVLSTRLPKLKEVSLLEGGLGSGFFILLSASLFHLYSGTFPELKEALVPLLFFCSIAKLRENQFKSACASRSKADLADDVLEQVWRNSKLLSCKFA